GSVSSSNLSPPQHHAFGLSFTREDKEFARAKELKHFLENSLHRAFESRFHADLRGHLRDAQGFRYPALFRLRNISNQKGEDHEIERAHDEVHYIHVLTDHCSEWRTGNDNGIGCHGENHRDCGQRSLTHTPAKRSCQQCKNEIKEERTVSASGEKADSRGPQNVGDMRPARKTRRDLRPKLNQ